MLSMGSTVVLLPPILTVTLPEPLLRRAMTEMTSSVPRVALWLPPWPQTVPPSPHAVLVVPRYQAMAPSVGAVMPLVVPALKAAMK